MSHLRRLKALVDKTEPLYVSEPLSWSRIGGFNSHDLLPLPYTEEVLDIVCAKYLDGAGRARPRHAVREPDQLSCLRRR